MKEERKNVKTTIGSYHKSVVANCVRHKTEPNGNNADGAHSAPLRAVHSGVSLIALVITIIVVIILAAIAFGTSTRTITNANFSDYVNNVAEVRTAFHTRAVTIKGEEAAKRQ